MFFIYAKYQAVLSERRGYESKAGGGKQTGGGCQVITVRKQICYFYFCGAYVKLPLHRYYFLETVLV